MRNAKDRISTKKKSHEIWEREKTQYFFFQSALQISCCCVEELTFLSIATNFNGISCDKPPAPLELLGDVNELFVVDFSDFVLQ